MRVHPSDEPELVVEIMLAVDHLINLDIRELLDVTHRRSGLVTRHWFNPQAQKVSRGLSRNRLLHAYPFRIRQTAG